MKPCCTHEFIFTQMQLLCAKGNFLCVVRTVCRGRGGGLVSNSLNLWASCGRRPSPLQGSAWDPAVDKRVRQTSRLAFVPPPLLCNGNSCRHNFTARPDSEILGPTMAGTLFIKRKNPRLQWSNNNSIKQELPLKISRDSTLRKSKISFLQTFSLTVDLSMHPL